MSDVTYRARSHLVLTDLFSFFYRVSRFIDKALGFAARASEAAPGEVDKWIDKAVREFCKYEEMFDRK